MGLTSHIFVHVIAMFSFNKDIMSVLMSQRAHWVPGWKNFGLLFQYGEDFRTQELFTDDNFIHKLWEPLVYHGQVTCSGKWWKQNIIKHCSVRATCEEVSCFCADHRTLYCLQQAQNEGCQRENTFMVQYLQMSHKYLPKRQLQEYW